MPNPVPWRNTYQWRAKVRPAVLERDGYRCRKCGDPGEDGKGRGLTVAHIQDHALGGSDTDLNNLLTLCRRCHGRIDGGKSRGGRGRWPDPERRQSWYRRRQGQGVGQW